jgi:FMN-dependent NADH-azoreductase
MMNILHVTCSPRGKASESYRISRQIIGFLQASEPAVTVVNRMLGDAGIPPVDEQYATALGAAEPSAVEMSPDGSMVRSEELIQELESADVVVIGTPMHNLTVPAALKLWIDHIVRVRRTFSVTPDGKVGMLRDRPVFIAVSSGGRFSGERTRQPDFLTPYLQTILSTIGLHDLTFFSVQGTGADSDVVAETRAETDRALQDYFSSFHADADAAV